jgi:C_GCAxxG_C_C family probable redox protein
MNTEITTEARNKCGNYFKEGYNCTESIFLAFREYLAPEIDEDTVKLLTGFGSGVGYAGCMCGALSGSIVALNMLKGRTSNQESREEAYKVAKEFHDRFENKFGVTCCRALNPYEHDTREQLTHCLKITGNTGKLLMEFLIEKGLYEAPESV